MSDELCSCTCLLSMLVIIGHCKLCIGYRGFPFIQRVNGRSLASKLSEACDYVRYGLKMYNMCLPHQCKLRDKRMYTIRWFKLSYVSCSFIVHIPLKLFSLHKGHLSPYVVIRSYLHLTRQTFYLEILIAFFMLIVVDYIEWMFCTDSSSLIADLDLHIFFLYLVTQEVWRLDLWSSRFQRWVGNSMADVRHLPLSVFSYYLPFLIIICVCHYLKFFFLFLSWHIIALLRSSHSFSRFRSVVDNYDKFDVGTKNAILDASSSVASLISRIGIFSIPFPFFLDGSCFFLNHVLSL